MKEEWVDEFLVCTEISVPNLTEQVLQIYLFDAKGTNNQKASLNWDFGH